MLRPSRDPEGAEEERTLESQSDPDSALLTNYRDYHRQMIRNLHDYLDRLKEPTIAADTTTKTRMPISSVDALSAALLVAAADLMCEKR